MTAMAIEQAVALGDCRIRLTFDDGRVQIVDFEPFLRRHPHPAVRAWLAPEKFAAFRREHGDLVWGDYHLCFPIADLYDNRIEHARDDLAA